MCAFWTRQGVAKNVACSDETYKVLPCSSRRRPIATPPPPPPFLALARIFQPQPPYILDEHERAAAKIHAQKQRLTDDATI